MLTGAGMIAQVKEPQTKPLFRGMTIVVGGFDEENRQQVAKQLLHIGVTVFLDYKSTCDFVLWGSTTMDDVMCPQALKDKKPLATKEWLEHCFRQNRVEPPSTLLHIPLPVGKPIPGAERLSITATGYVGLRRRSIQILSELIGAPYVPYLEVGQTTHLVCYNHSGDKYVVAQRSQIPTVNHLWLEDCLLHGRLLASEPYAESGKEVDDRRSGCDQVQDFLEKMLLRGVAGITQPADASASDAGNRRAIAGDRLPSEPAGLHTGPEEQPGPSAPDTEAAGGLVKQRPHSKGKQTMDQATMAGDKEKKDNVPVAGQEAEVPALRSADSAVPDAHGPVAADLKESCASEEQLPAPSRTASEAGEPLDKAQDGRALLQAEPQLPPRKSTMKRRPQGSEGRKALRDRQVNLDKGCSEAAAAGASAVKGSEQGMGDERVVGDEEEEPQREELVVNLAGMFDDIAEGKRRRASAAAGTPSLKQDPSAPVTCDTLPASSAPTGKSATPTVRPLQEPPADAAAAGDVQHAAGEMEQLLLPTAVAVAEEVREGTFGSLEASVGVVEGGQGEEKAAGGGACGAQTEGIEVESKASKEREGEAVEAEQDDWLAFDGEEESTGKQTAEGRVTPESRDNQKGCATSSPLRGAGGPQRDAQAAVAAAVQTEAEAEARREAEEGAAFRSDEKAEAGKETSSKRRGKQGAGRASTGKGRGKKTASRERVRSKSVSADKTDSMRPAGRPHLGKADAGQTTTVGAAGEAGRGDLQQQGEQCKSDAEVSELQRVARAKPIQQENEEPGSVSQDKAQAVVQHMDAQAEMVTEATGGKQQAVDEASRLIKNKRSSGGKRLGKIEKLEVPKQELKSGPKAIIKTNMPGSKVKKVEDKEEGEDEEEEEEGGKDEGGEEKEVEEEEERCWRETEEDGGEQEEDEEERRWREKRMKSREDKPAAASVPLRARHLLDPSGEQEPWLERAPVVPLLGEALTQTPPSQPHAAPKAGPVAVGLSEPTVEVAPPAPTETAALEPAAEAGKTAGQCQATREGAEEVSNAAGEVSRRGGPSDSDEASVELPAEEAGATQPPKHWLESADVLAGNLTMRMFTRREQKRGGRRGNKGQAVEQQAQEQARLKAGEGEGDKWAFTEASELDCKKQSTREVQASRKSGVKTARDEKGKGKAAVAGKVWRGGKRGATAEFVKSSGRKDKAGQMVERNAAETTSSRGRRTRVEVEEEQEDGGKDPHVALQGDKAAVSGGGVGNAPLDRENEKEVESPRAKRRRQGQGGQSSKRMRGEEERGEEGRCAAEGQAQEDDKQMDFEQEEEKRWHQVGNNEGNNTGPRAEGVREQEATAGKAHSLAEQQQPAAYALEQQGGPVSTVAAGLNHPDEPDCKLQRGGSVPAAQQAGGGETRKAAGVRGEEASPVKARQHQAGRKGTKDDRAAPQLAAGQQRAAKRVKGAPPGAAQQREAPEEEANAAVAAGDSLQGAAGKEGERVFLLGGGTRGEADYGAIIAQLGGRLCGSEGSQGQQRGAGGTQGSGGAGGGGSQQGRGAKRGRREAAGDAVAQEFFWQPEATHVILGQPLRRTEKLLAAMAAGRWVLRPEYLSASHRQGRFLPEAPFEWRGNPPSALNADGTVELGAAGWWRQMGESSRHCGAFVGLHVGLLKAPTAAVLQRVLRAGGAQATVVPELSALIPSSGPAYDVVAVPADTPRSNPVVQRLLSLQTACVAPEFFIEYLAKPSKLAMPLLRNTTNEVKATTPLLHVLFGSEPAVVSVLLDLKEALKGQESNKLHKDC